MIGSSFELNNWPSGGKSHPPRWRRGAENGIGPRWIRLGKQFRYYMSDDVLEIEAAGGFELEDAA